MTLPAHWLFTGTEPRPFTNLGLLRHNELAQGSYVVLQEAGTSLGPYTCLQAAMQSYVTPLDLLYLRSSIERASPAQLLHILKNLKSPLQLESFAKAPTIKLIKTLEAHIFRGEESLILLLMELSEETKMKSFLAAQLSTPRENARYDLAEASFYALRGQQQEEKRLLRLFEAARGVFELWSNDRGKMKRVRELELSITTKLLLCGYDVQCRLVPGGAA